jgi:uncharacterized protein YjbJ (UPF0337 family)
MDDNRVKGAARNVGGKIKEGVGRAVGDEKLKREGQTDQVTGKVENAVGGLKDEVRENERLREERDARR